MQTDKEYMTERSVVGLHSESSGEYPLPDYNGDVKRVLMINPRVVPTGRFITESSVEFSGTVFYDVVYLDAENNVSHADFSTDYEIAVKIDPDAYEDSYAVTEISGCNVRLIGPRKFSAKCSLTSDVRIMEKRCVEIGGDAFDGREPEILSASVNVVAPVFAVGEASEFKEEILTLDGAIEDEVTILMCDAWADVPSVGADEGGVEFKADVTVTMLYKNADSPILTKTLRIPYSGRISAEGFADCSSLFGRVEIGSLKSEVVPTEDGVIVFVSFSATPSVRGLGNKSIDIVRDSYLKELGTSNDYSDFSYAEHICTESAENNFSAELPLSEISDAAINGFTLVNAIARTDECELIEDRVRIKGEIRFTAIATEENENENNYTNAKFTVPFEEYVNVSCQNHDNIRVECHASVTDEKIEILENRVVATCRLSLFVTLNSQRKQRCLGASFLSGEEYEIEDSVVTVYYPDEKENVFDIAKKFHTSVRSIAEDNALTQNVFASLEAPIKAFGYKKLVIK